MDYRYVDVHAHMNLDAYDLDRGEVIVRTLSEGVAMMNVGTDRATSELAVQIAKEYKEGIYAAVALHPVDAARGEVFDTALYEALAREDVVRAIGECGLDYFRVDETTKALQKEVFIKHIELANKLGKPLMCHIRNAYADAIAILKEHAKVKGDIHFFAGTWAEAQEFLALGFTLSFTGVITFTKDYDEVVRNTPLDMILAETDCPFVTPVPFRGKRNEPMHVREVVKAIARIKELDEEIVRATVRENARRVFGL